MKIVVILACSMWLAIGVIVGSFMERRFYRPQLLVSMISGQSGVSLTIPNKGKWIITSVNGMWTKDKNYMPEKEKIEK